MGLKYLPPLEEFTHIIVPAYVGCVVLSIAFLYFIELRVKAQPESERTKKIHPKNAGKGKDKAKEEDVMTHEEHDLAELRQAMKQMAIQMVISLFLWYKWEFVRHFVMQTISQVLSLLLENTMVQCHIFGKEIDRSKKSNAGFFESLKEKLEEAQEKLEEPKDKTE